MVAAMDVFTKLFGNLLAFGNYSRLCGVVTRV
jgi:hypothetical protein